MHLICSALPSPICARSWPVQHSLQKRWPHVSADVSEIAQSQKHTPHVTSSAALDAAGAAASPLRCRLAPGASAMPALVSAAASSS